MIESLHANDGRNNMGIFASVGRAAFMWLSLLGLPAPAVSARWRRSPIAVRPDRRFLYAAVRSKPFSVIQYAIDTLSGALQQVSTSPLAESFPYISWTRPGATRSAHPTAGT